MNEFFAAGHYERNFMGIIVDPEELIANYEAGAPLAELGRRLGTCTGLSCKDRGKRGVRRAS
jgi:hypothetical protein